jgi:hypothetical protein
MSTTSHERHIVDPLDFKPSEVLTKQAEEWPVPLTAWQIETTQQYDSRVGLLEKEPDPSTVLLARMSLIDAFDAIADGDAKTKAETSITRSTIVISFHWTKGRHPDIVWDERSSHCPIETTTCEHL